MTTGPSEFWGQENADAFSSAFGRLAHEMAEAAKLGPAYALMAQPAATMAAAAAIGFGVSTQMASLFLGAMQGALDAAGRTAERFDERPPEETEKGMTAPARAQAAPEPMAKVAREQASEPGPAREPKPRRGQQPAAGAKPVAARAEAATSRAKPAHAKPVQARRKAGTDLKLIDGIGPKLEQVLKQKGISSLADIAAWTDENVARIDAELGLDGRIARDGWVNSAKALRKGKTGSSS